ncbi:hypothetical protein Btru_037909 [Bulinus truncatus]|nr:hypothetical protein Btru_037909 [Bulinus truncatus]
MTSGDYVIVPGVALCRGRDARQASLVTNHATTCEHTPCRFCIHCDLSTFCVAVLLWSLRPGLVTVVITSRSSYGGHYVHGKVSVSADRCTCHQLIGTPPGERKNKSFTVIKVTIYRNRRIDCYRQVEHIQLTAMSCLKSCLLLIVALTLLIESISCSPTYIWEDTDDIGTPDTIETITTIADKTDGSDAAPVLLQRLRRHLAQMYVGNHHYNYQGDTGSTGSRRKNTRKQNGVILARA